LREKGVEANKKGDAAEVKRLRDKIASWGFPSLVDEFDKALATPVAPTPPPPPPPPPPVAPASAGPPLVVDGDALARCCGNWSVAGRVDLPATAQVFEGIRAIAFTPDKESAAVYLHFAQ